LSSLCGLSKVERKTLTKKNKCYSPEIETVLDFKKVAKYFTLINLNSGCHQIKFDFKNKYVSEKQTNLDLLVSMFRRLVCCKIQNYFLHVKAT